MVHAIRRLGGAVPTSVVCKKRRELLMEYRIQELKLGGVLDQAISLTKNHFGILFTIMALVYIPAVLVIYFVQLSILPTPPTMTSSPEEIAAFRQAYVKAMPILVIPVLITGVILIPLANVAVVDAVARLYLGKPASAMDSLKVSIGKLLPLLGTSILAVLAIMCGALLIIPAFIFGFWFCLATHVVIIENISGPAALGRSRQLVRGNFWTVSVLGLVIWIISLALSMGAGLVTQPHLQIILQVILEAVTTVFATAAMVVFYFSCRCGHENFDLEHLARQMGESSSADTSEGDVF
jgi:hypothetical protein